MTIPDSGVLPSPRWFYASSRVKSILATCATPLLRNIIDYEREQSRAFGQLAEACRHELAKRGQRP